MPYVLALADGSKFNTDDLTLDESIEIEKDTEESWVFINPFRSARHFKAIASVALRRSGKSDDEIKTWLDGLTITTALDAVEVVKQDDLPNVYENGLPDPKAEDEKATST